MLFTKLNQNQEELFLRLWDKQNKVNKKILSKMGDEQISSIKEVLNYISEKSSNLLWNHAQLMTSSLSWMTAVTEKLICDDISQSHHVADLYANIIATLTLQSYSEYTDLKYFEELFNKPQK